MAIRLAIGDLRGNAMNLLAGSWRHKMAKGRAFMAREPT
jgi:hypothetical protein